MQDNAIEYLKNLIHQLENPEETPVLDKVEEGEKSEQKNKIIENGFYKFIPNGKTENGKTKWKKDPQFYNLAEYVISNYSIMTDDSFRLIYENNYFKHSSKTKLMKMICDLTHDQAKPTEIDQFLKVISAKAYKDRIDIPPPEYKINLSNGVYDLEKDTLLEHSSDYFFKYCLEHKYDKEARCPSFVRYLNFVLQDKKDLVDLVQQMFGYILMGGDPIAHRAFLLYGEGRNGKSTLLDTLRHLIGTENSSCVSMKDIGDSFKVVQMDGKLANIVEEAPNKIDGEAFKNIVGGGFLQASHKYQDVFNMKVNARLIFACNVLPTFQEATAGINDKLIIIPFKRYIRPGERDTEIKNKIFSEMSGVLNWAIDGYKSFKKNNFKFIDSKIIDDTLIEFRKETDSVYAWCHEHIKPCDVEGSFVIVDPVYEAYCQDCRSNTQNPVRKPKFLKRFKDYYLSNYGVELKSHNKWIGETNRKSYGNVQCGSSKYSELHRNVAYYTKST